MVVALIARRHRLPSEGGWVRPATTLGPVV
jgi:hypothetical protein